MSALKCPALLITASGSGSGKTIFTAGLARHYRNQGHRVRVFKIGPDYLDPMILEQASGNVVHSLDLWMVGEARCAELLYTAASNADVILIEGAMGLFDGTPCAADLAQRFSIPILALFDARGQAQTFGAIAYGFANYRKGLIFAGFIANRVGSPYHAQLLAECMPEGLSFLGGIPTDNTLTLPERHLGLSLASEIADLDERIEQSATLIAKTTLTALPPPVEFQAPLNTDAELPPQWLAGVRIAVARDAAFAFIYQANLDLLQNLGASLQFFSPLKDKVLPEVDAIYLPGGYPELHARDLAANTSMHTALRAHSDHGKPIYAECGGMLYLLETLQTLDNEHIAMAGLLPGGGTMHPRLSALGMQALHLGDKEIRGHTFHYSTANVALSPWLQARRQRNGALGEPVFKTGGITASYLHLYFPSNPQIAAGFFAPTLASADNSAG